MRRCKLFSSTAISVVAAILAFPVAAEEDPLSSIGGISFGEKIEFEVKGLPCQFGKAQVLRRDENGAYWFKPMPQGDFLGIPISPKNLFYFKASPKSGAVYEIGVEANFVLLERNEIRRGLEKFRISASDGYGTASKGMKFSPPGAKSETYGVFDRSLKRKALEEEMEIERESAARALSSTQDASIQLPENRVPVKPRRKSGDDWKIFGIELDKTFNRESLSGKMKVLKERNDVEANIVWFAPAAQPRALLGVQIGAKSKESSEEEAKQDGVEHFDAAWRASARCFLALSHKSRTIYMISVALMYPDDESLKGAWSFYNAHFASMGETAKASKAGEPSRYALDNVRELRIDLDEKRRVLALSIVSLAGEKLARSEREGAETIEASLGDLLSEPIIPPNNYGPRDTFRAK